MEKITVVNESGQTVSLWANDDLLGVLRRRAEKGEVRIVEDEKPEPMKATRKKRS